MPIGYPDWANYDGAADECTGVKRGRGRELLKMESHNVRTDITWKQAKDMGLKIVKGRWVDGGKPLPNDLHGVRSRCVAMEINHGPRSCLQQRDAVGVPLAPEQGHERHKGSIKVLESRNHRNT